MDKMDFLIIYDEHYSRIRKFILTINRDEWATEDLLQETFIRVKQNISMVRETEKISSWINKIAYNLSMDHLKKRKNDIGHGPKTQEVQLGIPFLKEIEKQQMGACIKEKMNLLPESSRIIIDLYDIMGFSHKEIAETFSITENNSKVKLHRARKELRAILNKACKLMYDERNVFICEPVHPKK